MAQRPLNVNPFAIETLRAAGEVCPIWPGKPATAHWGVESALKGKLREAGQR